MKFRQLAISNMLGNRHQYSAFFFSSVFAVMVFFVYASFIFHPDVRGGNIFGGQAVAVAMIACEVIITIFSFFFVLYSCSAFLKSRKKEFGLFTLFGFTKLQLRRMVLYENMLICLLSLGAGMGLGMLFNKLFYILISDMLDIAQPLRFYFPHMAMLLTAGGYIILFLLITLLSMRHATNQQISELLVASRQPKRLPLFSVWLSVLSVLSLGVAYAMAYTMNAGTMIKLMLPIIGLVVLGTYFLFTQSSVAVLKGLQTRKKIHYKNTNMIIISQLMFKLKDNATVLFLVTVLCAVILTASGFLNVLVNGIKDQLIERYPQTIGFMETGTDAHNVVRPEDVRRILKEDGAELEYEVKLTGLPLHAVMPGMQRTVQAMAVSQSDYNALAARARNMERVETAYGQAWFVYPYFEMKQQFVQTNEQLSMTVDKNPLQLTMLGQKNGEIARTPYLFVLNDKQYQELAAAVPDERKLVSYGFELKDWKNAGPTIERIAKLVPSEEQYNFASRTAEYASFRQFGSLAFFIAIFVSVLFFIASGSLLFFKLFTEMEEDKTQLQALRRIGLTHGEIKRIITVQIAALFYLPCLVGSVHTAFAMKALSNMLHAQVWLYSGIVLLVYLALQTAYFWFSKESYFKKVLYR